MKLRTDIIKNDLKTLLEILYIFLWASAEFVILIVVPFTLFIYFDWPWFFITPLLWVWGTVYGTYLIIERICKYFDIELESNLKQTLAKIQNTDKGGPE